MNLCLPQLKNDCHRDDRSKVTARVLTPCLGPLLLFCTWLLERTANGNLSMFVHQVNTPLKRSPPFYIAPNIPSFGLNAPKLYVSQVERFFNSKKNYLWIYQQYIMRSAVIGTLPFLSQGICNIIYMFQLWTVTKQSLLLE